jgi:DNA-binding transcriptional LysR family regulator
VTQSAVSNALSRLRQIFGDPLVVRNARGLTPTPRAERLAPQLEELMRSLGAIVKDDERFDATTTERRFTLACADYCTAIFGARLAALLGQKAPRAELRLLPLEQTSFGEGLASDVDLHVGMPPTTPSGCHSATLFDDSFVCLIQKRPGAPKKLKMPEYLASRHVRVSVLGSTRDAIDRALEQRGHRRQIALTVPHFSVLPLIVERTGYVATVSRRLARAHAARFDVLLCEPPLSLGSRRARMVWHERTHRDPGARFFRQVVLEAAGTSEADP